MGKIFNAIDLQELRPRINRACNEGFKLAKEDIASFYIQGKPKQYVRTGKYGKTPQVLRPTGSNGNYHYIIWLEPPEYTTGTYSGQKVMEEAQYHGSGILGRAGTWFEAEFDIVDAVKNAFK